jgi:hypothetical protein
MFKGAIIAGAVQYIQELKQNEASNIEKWTLEKLLMDQAVSELGNQLEHARRENERLREILEGEDLSADIPRPAPQQQDDDAEERLEVEETEGRQHNDRQDSAEAAAAAAIAAATSGQAAEEERMKEEEAMLAAKRTAEHMDQDASGPNKRARQ